MQIFQIKKPDLNQQTRLLIANQILKMIDYFFGATVS
jgi:hypothetical protein